MLGVSSQNFLRFCKNKQAKNVWDLYGVILAYGSQNFSFTDCDPSNEKFWGDTLGA
jgi:hypothetical protein